MLNLTLTHRVLYLNLSLFSELISRMIGRLSLSSLEEMTYVPTALILYADINRACFIYYQNFSNKSAITVAISLNHSLCLSLSPQRYYSADNIVKYIREGLDILHKEVRSFWLWFSSVIFMIQIFFQKYSGVQRFLKIRYIKCKPRNKVLRFWNILNKQMNKENTDV